MSELDEYTFLKAALDDFSVVESFDDEKMIGSRVALNSMYDSIEFILYEVLQINDQDVYRDSRNTIGTDEAIQKCKSLGIEIPMINTVRRIQKLRGDAKHHAQIPQQAEYLSLRNNFRIIISIIAYENFGIDLASILGDYGIMEYHTALYELHRKQRNHNWSLACKYSVSALIHKNRKLQRLSDDFICGKVDKIESITELLQADIGRTLYESTPQSVIDALSDAPNKLRQLTNSNQYIEATEEAIRLYDLCDKIEPALFDIERSQSLTPILYMINGFKFTVGKVRLFLRFKQEESVKCEITELYQLLFENPKFVETFGEAYVVHEDEKMPWSFWEFAIFDGEEWHGFIIEYDFYIKGNTFSLKYASENPQAAPEIMGKILSLILNEFRKAVKLFNNKDIRQ